MADHCIGPQLSFSAVEEDSDVEPRSGRNTAVLTQGVSEFQSYYGSGSKYMEYLARHLASEARELERRGVHRVAVCSGLHVAQGLYEETCSALRLHYESSFTSHVPIMTTSACTFELHTALVNGDDDLDWYFDDSEEPVTSVLVPNPVSDAETTGFQSTGNSIGCCVDDIIGETSCQELAWLMHGLQHCLPHDFEPLYTPLNSGGGTKSIALPMRLAGEVVRHFLATTGRDCLSATLQESLHVRCIPSLPTYRCAVHPGSLVLTSSLRAYDRAARCRRHSPAIPGGGDRATVSFHRCAAVQANLGQIGTRFNEGNATLGNSQQARSVTTQRVLSAEDYITNLRNMFGGGGSAISSSDYVQRVTAMLRTRRVELVICERGMATAELVDHLACAGIAVLTVGSAKELWSAADLTGAALVEDLAHLEEEDVGECLVELRLLHELAQCRQPTAGRNGATRSTADWSLRVAGGRASVSGSGATDGVAELDEADDGDDTHCLVALSRVGSGAGTEVVGTPAAAVVSVVIGGPCETLAAANEERFWRCLHRLRSAVEGRSGERGVNGSNVGVGRYDNTVMPGAGVPELLCILRIDEVLESRLGQRGVSNDDSAWQEAAVLQCVRRVLDGYLRQVLGNNAFTPGEAQERVHHCLELFCTRLSGGASILDVVRVMSTAEKLSLPVPIDLSAVYSTPEMSQGVLDVVQVKVAAVDAALMIVKQMLPDTLP